MPFTNFGTPTERKEFKSDFKKTLFVDMNATSTVRILTANRLELYTHYVNRANVACLGDDCPVCANNKVLIMQFPETFKEESKYSPKRLLKLVNVLDKTLVRVCPKCQTENHANGQAPSTCRCGEILTTTPTSSNKIKVLSSGVKLFDQLDAINNAILDTSGERIGLTGYDLTFLVSGTGKNKVITPITGQVSPAPEYDEKDLFDLENVTIKLTPAEMVDLQRGVSLKDIFSARKASAKVEAVAENPLPKELIDAVQADVDALFNTN